MINKNSTERNEAKRNEINKIKIVRHRPYHWNIVRPGADYIYFKINIYSFVCYTL
jgi:hypothetical protein